MEAGNNLFSAAPEAGTRFMLPGVGAGGDFWLGIRKKFLTIRAVEHSLL